MNTRCSSIKVEPHDVFDYVVGNSPFHPIERCIDPTVYEAMNGFIYNHVKKISINQSQAYREFCEGVDQLKSLAANMDPSETRRVSEELAEICPTTIIVYIE